ncbi:hypothetical protein [Streptomyces anthocyanicus]|uniref:hypothetical protein n=1 Tax=Streptomyces anthocyanicus TaxID=68174 RepID=UPI002E33BE7E|nr:hypothetical protein [Streptomyces anthocyanicus]
MIPPTAEGAGRPRPLTRACAAAAQTVSLVLAEDAPLPDSDRDVNDLVHLLRGHVAQLGALTAPGSPALLHAQQLCSDCIPEDYVPSRVYLVGLAEATHDLVAHVERGGPEPISAEGGRRWRRPTVNVLRGAVFVLALVCLIFAASVPRT